MINSQVLPSPPDDIERDYYFRRHILLLSGWPALGFIGVTIAMLRLASSHAELYGYFLVCGLMGVFFAISLRVNAFTHDDDVDEHRALVARWAPTTYPSIDVWLPVCGEHHAILANTWSHIQALQWPGEINVYVCDDGGDALPLATEFGFRYLQRPNRGWYKKSGNLRHAYQQSAGEFVVIFDADFCPRPDFLRELMPYFDDPGVGIVQSPQHFRVLQAQGWLERGAGSVQELFYRAIQVSRERRGGAICVGTNAIYRRKALDSNDGTTLIEHSEDVHTGFDLRRHGWALRYVPVVLATGMCPAELPAFFRQQYRWCMGSMSLLRSRKFWTTRMAISTRCCYLAGFGYYIATALNSVLMPISPVVLLLAFPGMVHLRNYLLLLPVILYSLIMFPTWHRCRYGLEAWTVQLIYGWAHLFALIDIARGRPMGWHPTGAVRHRDRRATALRLLLAVWSGGIGVLWLAMAGYRESQHTGPFIPMIALGAFYVAVVSRAFIPTRRPITP